MRPGEIIFGAGGITLNESRPTVELEVANTSDHIIFVSSHYPFFEVNRRLAFDRAPAWGMHLDIPAGETVRWGPGETKTVRLVPFGGRRVVRGFNGLTDGPATGDRLTGGLRRATEGGYAHGPAVPPPSEGETGTQMDADNCG